MSQILSHAWHIYFRHLPRHPSISSLNSLLLAAVAPLVHLHPRGLVRLLPAFAGSRVPLLVEDVAHFGVEHVLVAVLVLDGFALIQALRRQRLLNRRALQATGSGDLVSASDNIRLLANQRLAALWQGVQH